jgi:hypothetical protein
MTSGATARTQAASPARSVKLAAQAAVTFVIEGDDLPERRQAALQFPADLSALAEEQDLHGWRSP